MRRYLYVLSAATTLIVIGAGTGSPAANDLDLDVKKLRFESLESKVNTMPISSEKEYFAGVLANRCGRIEESVRLLEKTIPQIRITRPDRAAQALDTLADDYVKLYRYRDAADSYDDLLTHFAGEIDKNNLENIKDDYGVIKLIAKYPPETITMGEPIRLKTALSPIGSIDAELAVNDVKAPWILDTGANFSVVSASFAKRIGVQASIQTAQTKGTVNGKENLLHVGILPELKVGGATINNVVLLILEDDGLRLKLGPDKWYQIDAVLGFPVFQILGSATFTKSGMFEAGMHASHLTQAARVFMNKLTPLVECSVSRRKVLFSFDTGANASTFSVRYFREFPNQFKGLKKVASANGGAGGITQSEVYLLPEIKLRIADKEVVLKRISVLPFSVGTDVDEAYGNLGRDVFAGFESFTLDFKRMTFSLGSEKH